MASTELEIWARECAALIAKGYTPSRIASQHDWDSIEMDQILESKEFKEALEAYGPPVVKAWEDTKLAEAGSVSFRKRIIANLDEYAKELHVLAMSGTLKPEKRADILLALLRSGSGPEDAAPQRVEMPPQLLENWARRTREFEEHKGEFKFGTRTAHENPDATNKDDDPQD